MTNCEGCGVTDFKVNDVANAGTPVTMPDGTQIGTTHTGQTPGAPTFKVPGVGGGPQSIVGLMAWDAFVWGGWCIDEGGTCEQIQGCGATLTLKFMLMVPTGGGTNVTLTDPGGTTYHPVGAPRKMKGSATSDVYRIDFKIEMDAPCGTSAQVKLDGAWTVTINGVVATFHIPGGDIKFQLTCDKCEGAGGGGESDQN